MRIAWFTPFMPASAIGRFSKAVSDELARSVELDLWVRETEDRLEASARVVPYDRSAGVDPAVLTQYDLVVYNLGDSALHTGILGLSQEVPGLVILHDHVVHHLFVHRLVVEGGRPDEYRSLLCRHYGDAGEAFADQALADPRLWRDSARVVGLPLFEEAVRGAAGVVVHSRSQREAVERAFAGPVRHLRLPWTEGRRTWGSPSGARATPPGRLLMMSAGVVNDNRRIPAVLEALARSPLLREILVYGIAGHVEDPDRERLTRRIDSLGLGGSVFILGRLPDDEFHAWLQAADLCVNLRWPIMEGASASVIEQMMLGKPVIVTHAGVYSELPDDCVLKVGPAREIEDLTEALIRLASSETLRRQTGERARRWAARELTPRRYAGGLRAFAEELVRLRPVHDLLGRLAVPLREMGVEADDPIATRLAREAYDLFCSRPGMPEAMAATSTGREAPAESAGRAVGTGAPGDEAE